MKITPEARHACYKCEEELVFDVKIGRRDICPNCNSYLHCCFNCEFWDPNVHNQCRENQGEFIRDREEGNFCLYFTFAKLGEDHSSEANEAKSKLEALFSGTALATGDGAQTIGESARSVSTEDDARAKLDALFKKD